MTKRIILDGSHVLDEKELVEADEAVRENNDTDYKFPSGWMFMTQEQKCEWFEKRRQKFMAVIQDATWGFDNCASSIEEYWEHDMSVEDFSPKEVRK